jgi:hypothetical protein
MNTPAHSEWTTALATGGIARAVPFGAPSPGAGRRPRSGP